MGKRERQKEGRGREEERGGRKRGEGGREGREKEGANQSMVVTVSLVEDEKETGESKDSRGATLQLTLTIKLQSELTILQQKPLCHQ